jgi:hypothetical protein
MVSGICPYCGNEVKKGEQVVPLDNDVIAHINCRKDAIEQSLSQFVENRNDEIRKLSIGNDNLLLIANIDVLRDGSALNNLDFINAQLPIPIIADAERYGVINWLNSFKLRRKVKQIVNEAHNIRTSYTEEYIQIKHKISDRESIPSDELNSVALEMIQDLKNEEQTILQSTANSITEIYKLNKLIISDINKLSEKITTAQQKESEEMLLQLQKESKFA